MLAHGLLTSTCASKHGLCSIRLWIMDHVRAGAYVHKQLHVSFAYTSHTHTSYTNSHIQIHHTYLPTSTCTRMHIRCTHTHTHITHTLIYTRHTHKHSYTSHTHTYTHVQTHTHIYTCHTHTYKYIHTYAHVTHTHTYTG